MKRYTQICINVLRDLIQSCLHDSLICLAWHTDMCDMTHSYVWHDSLICVTWLIDTCGMTHWCAYVWHDSLIRVAWLIDVWHDPLICVNWLIYLRDMAPCHFWHDKSITYLCTWHDHRVGAWFMCVCGTKNWCVWYDSLIRVIWFFHECDINLSCVWCDSFLQGRHT